MAMRRDRKRPWGKGMAVGTRWVRISGIAAWAATREAGMAGMTHGSAPAIWMSAADHARTPSFGSWGASSTFRTQQLNLISGGQYLDALKMDVVRIRSIHGAKYDGAIQQMGEYVWTMGQ